MENNYSWWALRINELLLNLQAENIQQRWHAANELITEGEPALDALLGSLDALEWDTLHIALWVLGEVRHERALPALITHLDHDSLHVRLGAARALEKYQQPDARQALDSWMSKFS